MKRFSFAVIALGILTGCTTLSGIGKDNTPPPSPLVQFCPQKQINTLWRTQVGSGAHRACQHLNTVLYQGVIYTVDSSGQVKATQACNGKTLWSTGTCYSPNAGPSVCGDFLVFSTRQGEVVALDRRSGHCIWHICVGSQILAHPVIAGQLVLVKSVDGVLSALDLMNGQQRWNFKHVPELFMLQGDSAPCVARNRVYVGFGDGHLFALQLQTGKLIWEQMASIPKGISDLDCLVGVIADPVVLGDILYVSTYQAQFTAFSAHTGQVLWQRELSSYENFAYCGGLIVVTDDQGVIWALNRFNGKVIWKQEALLHRNLSTPLITPQGIWVGDAEGYVHLLSSKNGCFLARALLNGSGIYVSPITDGCGVIIRSAGGELLKVTAS